MSENKTDAWSESVKEHREMDVTVVSNAADGAVIDVNGTQIKLFQHDQGIPMLVELFVEDETQPLGAVNVAKAETVCLGGVDELLADRVKEIRQMPVEDMMPALKQLETRLNPTGRSDETQ